MARHRIKSADEVWAIIVAGGASRRMGFEKLTAEIEGRPVLAWSVAAFEACVSVDAIVLVCAENALFDLERIAREVAPTKLKAVVAGGAHRHLSVAEGLKMIPSDAAMIAVHDAARPAIDCAMIERCLEAARDVGAAACAKPVSDTLKRATADGFVTEHVEREGLWAVETPQIFRADLLRMVYGEVLASGEFVTDETSAVQNAGAPVLLVPTPEWNGKITYPGDLELARLVLHERLARSSE